MTLPKICRCGQLTTRGGRCPECEQAYRSGHAKRRERPQGSPHQTGEYRTAARRFTSTAPDWCSICGRGEYEYYDELLDKMLTDSLTTDHIIPLSLGGTNEAENFRRVHGSWNYARQAGKEARCRWLKA
jgi:hypothetical protein